MTVVLEPPKGLGSGLAAVLAEQNVVTMGPGVTGWRRPIAIILWQDERLSAFDPRGHKMALETIEALCPGACNLVNEAAESARK